MCNATRAVLGSSVADPITLAVMRSARRAIQELAGHAHITTTQRYMHLSPAALDQAIGLLEQKNDTNRGEILETRGA